MVGKLLLGLGAVAGAYLVGSASGYSACKTNLVRVRRRDCADLVAPGHWYTRPYTPSGPSAVLAGRRGRR